MESLQTVGFHILHAFSIILSVLLIATDYTLDIVLAQKFYVNGDFQYFWLTLAFMIASSLLMTAYSLHWYVADSKKKNNPAVSYIHWMLRIIFHICQLGPVIRSVEAIKFGYKSRKDTKNFKRLLKLYDQEHYYASTLKLIQSFVEGCPQILIQMYIVTWSHRAGVLQTEYKTFKGAITWVKIFMSLLSVAWALTYNRVKKMKGWNMRAIDGLGQIVQISWYIFTLLSRFLSLTLFAVSTNVGFTIVMCLHWFFMTIWLYLKKTNKFQQAILEIFYDMWLAIAYLFHYIKVKDVPTRRHYLLYYNLIFLEGAIMISYWFNQTRDYIKEHPELAGTPSAHIPVILFCVYLLSFAIGMCCMFLYYTYLHPSKEFIKAHRWHILSIRSKQEAQDEYADLTNSNVEEGSVENENMKLDFLEQDPMTGEASNSSLHTDSLENKTFEIDNGHGHEQDNTNNESAEIFI